MKMKPYDNVYGSTICTINNQLIQIKAYRTSSTPNTDTTILLTQQKLWGRSNVEYMFA